MYAHVAHPEAAQPFPLLYFHMLPPVKVHLPLTAHCGHAVYSIDLDRKVSF